MKWRKFIEALQDTMYWAVIAQQIIDQGHGWMDIINEVNVANKLLQNIKMELSFIISTLGNVLQSLKNLINDESFQNFLADATTSAEKKK